MLREIIGFEKMLDLLVHYNILYVAEKCMRFTCMLKNRVYGKNSCGFGSNFSNMVVYVIDSISVSLKSLTYKPIDSLSISSQQRNVVRAC